MISLQYVFLQIFGSFIVRTFAASDQYFIFNETGSPLENHLVCDVGVNCYVSCLKEDICHNLVFTSEGTEFITIDAQNSNNLYLECIGEESCSRMNILPPKNGNTRINCDKNNTMDGVGACTWIKVLANITNNVTIHCSKTKDCYGIDIDIQKLNYLHINFAAPQSGYHAHLGVDHITDALYVICNGSESCRDSKVFCSSGSLCTIECIAESSCASMTFDIPSATYDTLRISCVDNHCFWFNDTLFPMLYNADIYCSDTQQSSSLIYNVYSDHLSCHEDCCPFEVQELQTEDCVDAASSLCVVDCSATLCDGKIINGTSMESLSVLCRDTNEDGVHSTCNGLHVVCPLTGNCSIECDIDSGCNDLNVKHNADAVSNTHVSVLCSSDLSCYNINITAVNAFSVTINATANHTLLNGDIHVENVHRFQLICYSDTSVITCTNNTFYISDDVDNFVYVTCYGGSCGNLYFYVLDEWRAAANMNMNIVSDCTCDKEDCVDLIGISCAQHNNIQYAQIKNGNCSDLCGCDDLMENIQNNYIETGDGCIENNSNKKRQMTTGTIIGIVVALFILCVLVLLLWYFRIYRNRLTKQIRPIHVKSLSHVEDDQD